MTRRKRRQKMVVDVGQHKLSGREANVTVAVHHELPKVDPVDPAPFLKDNLQSLRDTCLSQLLNLRDDLADARTRRAAIAATLEGWRDEIEETLAILKAHR